jgi:tetratricopeptide (TPR) repeat protein
VWLTVPPGARQPGPHAVSRTSPQSGPQIASQTTPHTTPQTTPQTTPRTRPRTRPQTVAHTVLRAKALAWDTGVGCLRGDLADREAHRRAVLAMYDGAADPGGRARAEWFLAYAGIDLGDLSAAEELLGSALPVFEALGDRWGEAAALAGRAKLAHVRGDLAAIERDSGRSAQLFGRLGDRWGQLEATGWLGALAEMSGDIERAERMHRDGLRMAEELGLWTEFAGRLAWLGWLALQRGANAEAEDWCERALRLAAEQGHQPGQIFALIGLAFAARRRGRLDAAETHLRDVLSRTPSQDAEEAPPPYLVMILTELGFVAEHRGEAAEAVALHLRTLDVAGRLGGGRDMSIAIDGLAGAMAVTGRHDRAARLLGAATAMRASGSLPVTPVEGGDIERITARVRDALGEERFAAESQRGEVLTLEEVRSLVTLTDAATSRTD